MGERNAGGGLADVAAPSSSSPTFCASTRTGPHDGAPTTDSRVALDGFLLPVGGHKGYGLALMVDLLAGVCRARAI